MNDVEQPGIKFLGVTLKDLHFAVEGDIPDKISVGITFDVKANLTQDKKGLDLFLETDVFGNLPAEERPPIELRLTLKGQFQKMGDSGLSLEEFAKVQAPAHLVPYLREIISNVTARSSLPTLNLGPINLFAMIRDGHADFVVHEEEKTVQEIR